MHLNSIALMVLITCSLFALFTYCSTVEEYVPLTENEVFNQLLEKAPVTFIDLDEIPVDTIFVKMEHILGSESSSFFSEPVYFASPRLSIISKDDSLYLANRQSIFVMDKKEGIWQRSVGRKGSGPGEFDSFLKLASNSTNIFAFDYGNARIHTYDNDLNLLYTVNDLIFGFPFYRNYAVSESHLYHGLDIHMNEHMVAVYSIDNFINRIDTFWPKIIQNGYQPAPYNNVIFDVNRSEKIAITNLGLPYLFLLNPDKSISDILYFESSKYEQLENPSAKPVRVEGNTEHDVPRVSTFIYQIQLNDCDSIYFSLRNILYKIVPVDHKYKISNAWVFIPKDPSLFEYSHQDIEFGDMTIEEDTLFFFSRFEEYVFKVSLNSI